MACDTKHEGAATNHCVLCGELTGSKVITNPHCSAFHAEYATWKGHNFCPDCGEEL